MQIPGNSEKEASITSTLSIAYSGYTPIGVVGYTMPSAFHHLYYYSISGNTLSFGIRCTGLTTVTATVYFTILYKK